MEKISNYKIIEKIDETNKSIVYRGQKDKEEGTVIVKVLKSENPTPSEIARFKHEYNLIKNIDLDGIIKTHDIINYNGGIALILEDFEGISLSKILKNKKLGIRSFLQIAIKLANILGNLHIGNIIHKDIKPNNILINAKAGKLKITDFGISTVITHEDEQIYNPDVIEGTLVYMSPEQTGRINRTVDYRTDLYSLGVTFYEMLTGRAPFKSKDPMEIIHSHIARKPTSPIELNASIPEVISYIIMKLLSKTAEDRYQNGFGLVADLKNCLNQLKTKGKIENFQIARQDISIRFNIPQKLFGREKEIDALMSSFERVSNGTPEVMLVSGRPGLGKSALINEIHKPIVAKKGYFISGKFEQFRQDVPYSAIIQAFQGLIKQLLSERKEMIDRWKENLLQALGPNGKIITQVIPEVEHIIGPQEDIVELGPEESRNRFDIVFKNFTKVFAKKEHPLVLFLDDLQWSDTASLQLLKKLASDSDIQFFFLIGAYRNNEVNESDPLMLTIDDISKAGVSVKNILLGPLKPNHVNNFIVNFLVCNEAKSLPLAKLVHGKTGGNPFFINQFMETLYENKLLKLDPKSGWLWDIKNIRQMQLTDNVVDILSSKLTKLKESIRETLKICACIGNRFDLETLSFILNKPIETILIDINEAINDGFISFTGNIYRFQHNRIQEASYSLIPEDKRAEIHLAIGRLSLEKTDKKELPDKIFYIVNQLNHGINLLATEEERDELAELNLLAGSKAKSSTAYLPALKHLKLGISLLRKKCWQTQYDLTLRLYEEAAEAAYLSGEFEEMGDIFDTALQKINNVLDMVKFYETKVLAYISQNNLQEAIKIGLSILKLLGVRFPQKPNKLHILLYLLRVKLSLRGRQIEDLLKLPEMTDPYKLSVMRIITGLAAPAFQGNPELFALLALKQLYISVKYGNTSFSANAYSIYGLLLCSVLGDIDSGYKFGRLALDLLERLNDKKLKSQNIMVFNAFIRHWKDPLKEVLPHLLEGYQIGLETGNLENGAYCLFLYNSYTYSSGKELLELESDISKHTQAIRKIKQETPLNYIAIMWQTILNLVGKAKDPYRLIGEGYNEEEMLPIHLEANDRSAIANLYFHKYFICYLFQEYSKALENINKVKEYLDGIQSTIGIALVSFHNSLIRLALYPDAGKLEKRRILKDVSKHQKKLKKWAGYNPDTCQHKFYLVEAERAGVLGNYEKASKYYDQAIKLSIESGFVNEEAIANELAAKFYLSRDQMKIARTYMQDARYAYLRWGATAKVKDIEEKYPDLVSTISQKRQTGTLTDTTTASSTESTSEILDLSTVMKASHAISGEIILGKLLSTMMKIVIENAGAQKGFIILVEKNELLIEAVGEIEQEEITVMQSIPVDTSSELSSAIVNYVERTKENLILNDATGEGMFTSDKYIKEKSPKSILCAPIINQGRLTGILYLENNLTTGAFTPDRIEVLSVLSSQIAISIDNARLYTNLEDKVKERTRELQEAKDEIWGEMQLAKKIQTVLLPHSPVIPDYDIIGHMTPADEVGGDYYDVINGEDVDWVIIGDVSGHGVTAGLVMMMVQSCIQAIIRDNSHIKPSVLLEIVDRAICYNVKQLEEDKYMTITALAFYRDGRIIYSGLHQDLLIYRSSTESVETIETNGMWLGIDEDLGRLNENFEFSLNADDILLLYTDGITEAVDKDGNMFDFENLEKILGNCGKDSPDDLKNEILKGLNDYIYNDDVTMVILKRLL